MELSMFKQKLGATCKQCRCTTPKDGRYCMHCGQRLEIDSQYLIDDLDFIVGFLDGSSCPNREDRLKCISKARAVQEYLRIK